jgi:hypothetical protein
MVYAALFLIGAVLGGTVTLGLVFLGWSVQSYRERALSDHISGLADPVDVEVVTRPLVH